MAIRIDPPPLKITPYFFFTISPTDVLFLTVGGGLGLQRDSPRPLSRPIASAADGSTAACLTPIMLAPTVFSHATLFARLFLTLSTSSTVLFRCTLLRYGCVIIAQRRQIAHVRTDCWGFTSFYNSLYLRHFKWKTIKITITLLLHYLFYFNFFFSFSFLLPCYMCTYINK